MSNPKWSVAWAAAILLLTVLWVAVTPPLLALASNSLPVVAGLLFVLAFIGLGLPAARLLVPEANRPDCWLLALVIGVGLTGAATFLPATLGFVDPTGYALWTLAGLGSFVWHLVRTTHRPPAVRSWTVLDWIGASTAAVVLLVITPSLLAPVASTDAMEYHLMIPQLVLGSGQWGPMPNLVESGYPNLASAVYLLAMPLAGDVACKAVHFWIGIALLVAMTRLVVRVEPRASRWLAPGAYLTMPVAATIFSFAWNDNLFVLCLLVALAHLADHHGDLDRPGAGMQLAAAGIALGVAAWTKYTIVMVLLGLAPLLLLAVWRWGWRVRHLMWIAGPVVLISLFVFVKNWAFTGNPFYPFLHEVFPSPYWSDASAAYFHAALRRWEIQEWHWHTPVTFVVHMVFTPRLIDIQTGVVPLALLPLALGRRRGRVLSLLRWFLLFQLLAWYVIQTETRSLLTVLAVLLCVAAPAFERLIWSQVRLRWAVASGLLAAGLASLGILVTNAFFLTQPVAVMLDLESRGAFLRREVQHFAAAQWLEENQARGALLVGLKRPYYVTVPAWFSAFADTPIAQHFARGATTGPSLHQRLMRMGISHIVVHHAEYADDLERGLYTWEDTEREAFEALLADHCDVVAEFPPIVVYRLR